jgi:hypothetical protein
MQIHDDEAVRRRKKSLHELALLRRVARAEHGREVLQPHRALDHVGEPSDRLATDAHRARGHRHGGAATPAEPRAQT